MSSVLGRQETDPQRRVQKKYSNFSEKHRIEEIDKEIEEIESPEAEIKQDVLEEAGELVNDDDIIS